MNSVFAPLVSIIIPVYNGSRYMREAIDSALRQTYANKEVIIINDGSSDGGKTLEIALSYGDKVRLIDKPNGGVATALNAGIQASQGDYISWLSHDDIYSLDKLETQVGFLSRIEDKDTIIFGDYDIIDEHGMVTGEMLTSSINVKNMAFELYSRQIIHGCTLLVPKKIFEKTGFFRTDLPTTQDYDLWMKASSHYPFAHVPGKFVYSRQHAEQGSRTLHHREELVTWYLNNLSYITPDWLDANFEPSHLRDKYNILIQKFSHPDFKPVYQHITKQAREHLSKHGDTNPACFYLHAKFFYYIGIAKRLANKMVYQSIRNVFRRGPNTARKTSPNTLDFIEIYKKNIFGSKESHSGSGSTMEQTAYLREALPQLLHELGAKTLLDVPCGDFHWMQHVDLNGIDYIGGDIVPELIQTNQEKYGNAHRQFRMLNIITDDLPATDVIMCRDCLVHLNFESGLKAIENFKRSGAKYLLTTTFTHRPENEDLYGIWRPLNLQKAPYNLPQPIKSINERCTEGDMKFTDKHLSLWVLKDI